ncbi:MAG: cfa [Gammaproteobacteria bacterium]|nr:cfa [Gammaproteobacteria bacterium]
MLLSHLLNRLIKVGTLRVIDANGKHHLYQGTEGPHATLRLHDRSLHHRLFTNPRLALGEAYMHGQVTIEDTDLYGFLELIGMNMRHTGQIAMDGVSDILSRYARSIMQYNSLRSSRANVARHYDLSENLYDLFLDRDKQYSCAYFNFPGADLEQAQEEKKRHIAAKLLLAPGQKVLDIGCGWGGLAIHLARESGAIVTGLTLSGEQLRSARERVSNSGLTGNVSIHQRDYREQTGEFDRIVSIGMFEHVGIGHYKHFFRQLYKLLRDDGVALLHTIGRMRGPGVTDPWYRKYIFPGGYVPALSEILPFIEQTGFMVTDIEILRLHYAETLRHWRRRFLVNRLEAAALYDETFCRMWEYYLASSEIAFRYLGSAVFQIQLAKQHHAVPLTRDYMSAIEPEVFGKDRRRNNRRAA